MAACPLPPNALIDESSFAYLFLPSHPPPTRASVLEYFSSSPSYLPSPRKRRSSRRSVDGLSTSLSSSELSRMDAQEEGRRRIRRAGGGGEGGRGKAAAAAGASTTPSGDSGPKVLVHIDWEDRDRGSASLSTPPVPSVPPSTPLPSRASPPAPPSSLHTPPSMPSPAIPVRPHERPSPAPARVPVPSLGDTPTTQPLPVPCADGASSLVGVPSSLPPSVESAHPPSFPSPPSLPCFQPPPVHALQPVVAALSEVFTAGTAATAITEIVMDDPSLDGGSGGAAMLVEVVAVAEVDAQSVVAPPSGVYEKCPSSVSSASCASFLSPTTPFLPFRPYVFLLSMGSARGDLSASVTALRVQESVECMGGRVLDSVQEAATLLKEGCEVEAASDENDPSGAASPPSLIVLSDAPRRTIKCLFQLARGLLCVHVDWVERVAQERRLVPLYPYVLDQQPTEAEFAASVRARDCTLPLPMRSRVLSAAEQALVLIGGSAFVKDWSAVISAAGGRPLQCTRRIRRPCARKGRSASGTSPDRPCAVHLHDAEGLAAVRSDCVLVHSDGDALPACCEAMRKSLGLATAPVSWLANCLTSNALLPMPGGPRAAVPAAASAGQRGRGTDRRKRARVR